MSLIEDLNDMIQGSLRANAADVADQGVVTGWVIVVETMGTDGNRYLAHYGDEDSPPWSKLGMLTFVAKAIGEYMIYGQTEDKDEE